MATSGLDRKGRMKKAIRHFHDAINLRFPRHDLERKFMIYSDSLAKQIRQGLLCYPIETVRAEYYVLLFIQLSGNDNLGAIKPR
jgi:hypothetical protein